MGVRLRVIISLAAALLMLLSAAGNAFAATPKMVKVIIGWNQSSSGLNELTISSRGGRMGQTYHLLDASTAEVPENQISLLKKMSGVAYVEIDSEVQLLAESVPWGITSIKADQTWDTTRGAGVKVAVIDTGVDLDHSDLQVYGNVSFVSGAATGDDDHGHGTHVAGTIAALDNEIGVIGVAPEARIYAVKVLDSTGFGYTSAVISGIQWAVDHGMNIINMSLGDDVSSTAFQQACDNAYNAGILVVAAAGNSGTSTSTADSVGYPAKYDSVIAVGAIGSSNTRASFSSTGPAVELAAPGVSIYSTLPNNRYATASGTSMASPHVAGAAALLMAAGVADSNHNGRVNDEVRAILDNTAVDLGTAGRDVQYGYGLVNTLAAVQSVASDINAVPVANAGSDRSVVTGSTVTLDGSASRDANGDSLSYSWVQTAGTAVELSDSSAVAPTFTAAETGSLTFELTVSDGESSSSDSVTITVMDPADNTPPAAEAGTDKTVYTGTRVSLDGSASSDADGDSLTYRWTQTQGTPVSLSSTSAIKPTFTPTETGTCVFELTVSDGLAENSDSVIINVISNSPPSADAGADQTAYTRSLVTLDGSASSDTDGDRLTYYWKQTYGRTVSISSKTSARAYIKPTTAGTYRFTLTVKDGRSASTDSVTVTVTNPPPRSMIVQSITVKAVQKSSRSASVTATVTVTDLDGKILSGVTVKGHWEGKLSGRVSSRTNTRGTATFAKSSTLTTTGTTFTFVVDSLTKTGYAYDPDNNQESRDSVVLTKK